jgi:hypothetical protein
MKKIFFNSILFLSIAATGCYKLQKDYNYVPSTLDPNINMTAAKYLYSRGSAGVGSDTIFKWMQLGIEYAGMDTSEYSKPGRTFIFLHNNAIKTVSSNKVTAGFFFDYPVVVKNSSGVSIKSLVDPTLDSVRPANTWSDYPRSLVKNYFLYLIIQGEYTFENLTIYNQTVPTLLPAGTTASKSDSKLGWVVTKTTPNPDPTAAASILFDPANGTGFDPEGKMNLRMGNNDKSPITINDRTDDRTAGIFATNGKIHVYDKTVHPFRYSY